MSRPKKSEIQLETIREQILDIAYTILQDHGYEAISTRAIANVMEVAHMSLYTYFENQASILRALRERELSKWYEKLQIFSQRTKTENIIILVEETLQFIISFARENPNLYKLAWIMPEVGIESVEESRYRMRKTVEQLAGLIKFGMDSSVFEKRDPFLAGATVLGMINTPFILFYSGKIVDSALRDIIADETLSAVMLYLIKK